jgi:hypothetical protein
LTVRSRSGGQRKKRERREKVPHWRLGFRRACRARAVVPSVAELLGGGEDADEERGDEASTVARLDGLRWPEAHAVARRRSRCGGEL